MAILVAGPQRSVLHGPVGKRVPGIERRQPSKRRGEVDELDPHGRCEWQRGRSGVGADGDVDFAGRMEPAKLPE